jgi:hypothetical protein
MPSNDGIFLFGIFRKEKNDMKFKVTYNVRPNMFGKPEGTQTIMSDDGSSPYTIDECLNKIIFPTIKDKDILEFQKRKLLEVLEKFPVGASIGIGFKNINGLIYVERLDDSTTIVDLIPDIC